MEVKGLNNSTVMHKDSLTIYELNISISALQQTSKISNQRQKNPRTESLRSDIYSLSNEDKGHCCRGNSIL